jgi:hypothetical protein
MLGGSASANPCTYSGGGDTPVADPSQTVTIINPDGRRWGIPGEYLLCQSIAGSIIPLSSGAPVYFVTLQAQLTPGGSASAQFYANGVSTNITVSASPIGQTTHANGSAIAVAIDASSGTFRLISPP